MIAEIVFLSRSGDEFGYGRYDTKDEWGWMAFGFSTEAEARQHAVAQGFKPLQKYNFS